MQVYVKCAARQPGKPSGDAWWYSEVGGLVWATVVDGLGSGPEAALPAHRAVEIIQRHLALATDVVPARVAEELIVACDHALRGTRGAAIGLTAIDVRQGKGWYVGIGNIRMVVMGRMPAHPINTAGIVGTGVRKVRVEPFDYQGGDLVIMHSDGISSQLHVSPSVALSWNLEVLGERLVSEYAKSNDDMALILLRHDAA